MISVNGVSPMDTNHPEPGVVCRREKHTAMVTTSYKQGNGPIQNVASTMKSC